MTDKVVSIKGSPVIDPAAPPDPLLIENMEWLTARVKSGEIVGIQAQFVYRDETIGSRSFGFYTLRLLGEMFVRATRLAEQLDK